MLPSNYNSLSNETRWNKQNSDGWELCHKSCERIYLSIVKQYKSLKTYAGMTSPFLEEKWGLHPRFSFSTKVKILNETLRILGTYWWPTSVCCQQNILAISIIKRQHSPDYWSNLICFVNKTVLEIFYLLLVNDKPHSLDIKISTPCEFCDFSSVGVEEEEFGFQDQFNVWIPWRLSC